MGFILNIKTPLKIAFYLLIAIWAVYLIDLVLPIKLTQFGILPRSITGLIGIICAPFLHANLLHIVSNSLPLFVLSAVLFVFYRPRAVAVILLSILIGGGLTWLMGRESYHVGASGLIYSLAAFLIAAGIFTLNIKSLIISIIIIVFYGGLFWGIFPTALPISWEGHLFGAIAGVLIAYLFKRWFKKDTTSD